MTASVMITPKTMPTTIKRLFISKIIQTQIKMKCHLTYHECNYLEKIQVCSMKLPDMIQKLSIICKCG
jgi:hypothetical protein